MCQSNMLYLALKLNIYNPILFRYLNIYLLLDDKNSRSTLDAMYPSDFIYILLIFLIEYFISNSQPKAVLPHYHK